MHTNAPILGGMMGSTATANAEAGQTLYGIKEAMAEKGFDLNQDFVDLYASEQMEPYHMMANLFGNQIPNHSLPPVFTTMNTNFATYNVGEAPASEYSEDLLKTADDTAAVVLISRDSSEASDYHPDMVSEVESDSFDRPLALSQNEKDLIAMAKKHSTKVIVLLNTSSTMEIEELKQDKDIDSILWVGDPGVNGFLGVADVLAGAVTPSGKLTDTYSSSTVSSPAMVNFGVYLYTRNSFDDSSVSVDDQGDAYSVETEGIYKGYKYYETRYEDAFLGNGNATDAAGSSTNKAWNYEDEMSYPFGYGLSYTTFEQSLKSVDVTVGGEGTAVIEIKNTGDVAGKDVAELFVQTPYTEGGLEKASVQLLGFAKSDVIEPGKTEEVTVTFNPRYMASYDEAVVKEDGTEGAWVLDAGEYYFAIGNGAHNAINNILAKKTDSTEDLVSVNEDEQINADNAVVWNLDTQDVETYSENVQNTLQDMDINKLIPGSVEYTTRADWTKGWTPVMELTPTDDMVVDLTQSRDELTENGDGVTWGANNGLNIINMVETDENGVYTGTLPLDDPKWQQLVEQVSLDDAINFIENAGNGLNRIDSINFPANPIQDGPTGIASDQVAGYFFKWVGSDTTEPTYVDEQDECASYNMNVFPTEPVVASTFNQELVLREGEMYGEESLWSNIPGTLSPGVNLHRVPYCARNHEYYSEDPLVTNLMATAFCTGGTNKGLMTEPKHLAFNHQEANRTGVSVFMTEQAARETDLVGFEGALSSNQAMGVMTAYNRIGAVYASAHSGLLEQILRNEWGFDGWIVTDMAAAPSYMNWLGSIANGTSGMLTTSATTSSGKFGSMTSRLSEIKKDTAFQEKMQSALKYYFYETARSNALNGITEDTTVTYVHTWWQNAIIALEAVTAVLTVLFLGLYLVDKKKKGGEKA
ncbi:MAG: glycoside hydrolase family 3 N-terminal domain-containing protein [Eubacteriales bacterium]|nr:glycoside hydrolase family 3 N-terminal domain-containing protein [Eubacteriales bacterium]